MDQIWPEVAGIWARQSSKVQMLRGGCPRGMLASNVQWTKWSAVLRVTWSCILCDLSQGVLGYETIISLWDICIAICLVRVVCERLTIMARKLIETLFTYSFATYYGLMMFFVVLWQMIRRLAIPPRAKRRETRKWVGPMFVGHVVNFSCVHFTPYKHSSYAFQWVDSSKESVLMPLLPSLFSLSLFGTIYPTDYCFYLQEDSWNVV